MHNNLRSELLPPLKGGGEVGTFRRTHVYKQTVLFSATFGLYQTSCFLIYIFTGTRG